MGVVRIAFYLGNRLLRDSNWQYEKTLPRRDRKFYLAVTVIVVVIHELTYPAGRLCDVILWPPGPIVVTVVVNPALLQIDLARFNRTPIKLGTVHCEIGVGVGVAAGVGVGVAVGAGVGVAVGLCVGVGVGEPNAACKSKTQSGSPALLFPGVVKLWLPLFGNGEPATVWKVALVGSNHFAVTGPPKFPIATVNVCATGV